MNNWNFFREAVKNFRSTGAIARASPVLIKRLISAIPSDAPLNVVELGPGEGCITRALLERLHPRSRLTAFEINPAFVRRLQVINDPRLQVLPIGADRLTDHLPVGSVDFVVSSLPLSMIDQQVKERIVAQSRRVLAPNGQFLQYQYALQDYGLLKDTFPNVSVSFTLANLPPAFVYSCSLGLL
ncbi:class I SAM-dependent methyltransferase [Neolewinella litorea]|uniref:Methyltransferase domain-containing protein n=1 Tax=Neolewinella litorea TaxID=2562452 RepID=A0A4S4NMA9_9BACT|nr:methyltransferase domain-containing protein [Neolewinella litorea]THH39501.1 methyltransferase domain-containing protein [Neolewinella litorea]